MSLLPSIQIDIVDSSDSSDGCNDFDQSDRITDSFRYTTPHMSIGAQCPTSATIRLDVHCTMPFAIR